MLSKLVFWILKRYKSCNWIIINILFLNYYLKWLISWFKIDYVMCVFFLEGIYKESKLKYFFIYYEINRIK